MLVADGMLVEARGPDSYFGHPPISRKDNKKELDNPL